MINWQSTLSLEVDSKPIGSLGTERTPIQKERGCSSGVPVWVWLKRSLTHQKHTDKQLFSINLIAIKIKASNTFRY